MCVCVCVCVCVVGYRSSVTSPVGRSLMLLFSSTLLSAEVNLCHPNTQTHTWVCILSFCGWVSKSAVSINALWQRGMTAETGHTETTEATSLSHTHTNKPSWFTAFPPMACTTSSFSNLSHAQVSVLTDNPCQRQVHVLCWPSQAWVLSETDRGKQKH